MRRSTPLPPPYRPPPPEFCRIENESTRTGNSIEDFRIRQPRIGHNRVCTASVPSNPDLRPIRR